MEPPMHKFKNTSMFFSTSKYVKKIHNFIAISIPKPSQTKTVFQVVLLMCLKLYIFNLKLDVAGVTVQPLSSNLLANETHGGSNLQRYLQGKWRTWFTWIWIQRLSSRWWTSGRFQECLHHIITTSNFKNKRCNKIAYNRKGFYIICFYYVVTLATTCLVCNDFCSNACNSSIGSPA